MSLYNAALLVHGFHHKLGFFADFLYMSIIAQSPVLRKNLLKRRVRAVRPKSVCIYIKFCLTIFHLSDTCTCILALLPVLYIYIIAGHLPA
jgi:hypothetical protein